MQIRGLLILAVVTLVAVVSCWFAIDQRYQDAAVSKQEGGLIFASLQRHLGDIAEIEVARSSGRFSLLRRETGWANMGGGGYPAIETRVDEVIHAIAGLKYIEAKTKRSQLHHKLGVEDVAALAKSTRLTFKDGTGAVLADIIVGKVKKNANGLGRQGVYVRLPGNEQAWLAEGLLDVHYDAVEWSDRMVVDIDAGSLKAMSVRGADGGVVALQRQQPQDLKLTLVNLPVGTQIVHQYQIDYMAGLLQGVRFEDARPISTADLETTSAFEVVAQSNDHLVVKLHASEPLADGSVWARINAEVTKDVSVSDLTRQEVARINFNFGNWHIKLPRTMTNRLRIRLEDIVKDDHKNKRLVP